MLNKLNKIWKKHGFEILILMSVIVILFLALTRFGKSGTWSMSYYYPVHLEKQNHQQPKRGPPKDSRGELECRRVLQKIFKKPFNKDRPNFLRNKVTGGIHNLELDCFESEMRLALEFNGIQHYKFVPYFHKNKEAFLNQKYRDEIKRRMCKDNGIMLIEVPYTTKLVDIESYIRSSLRKIGYKC